MNNNKCFDDLRTITKKIKNSNQAQHKNIKIILITLIDILEDVCDELKISVEDKK